jgi:hypothetical protein
VGDAHCHGVQPIGNLLTPAYRAGLAGEHEEGGLEGVLGILVVSEHTPAHAPDQRAMALHKGGECRLVAKAGE